MHPAYVEARFAKPAYAYVVFNLEYDTPRPKPTLNKQQ